MVSDDGTKARVAELHVSEPWEFEEQNPSPKIVGVVEAESDEALLLLARVPVTVDGRTFEWFVCSTRYEGATIADAAGAEGVACNATGVPPERLKEARDLDVSWCRGAGAVVGSLRFV